jgi:hypothetical protein
MCVASFRGGTDALLLTLFDADPAANLKLCSTTTGSDVMKRNVTLSTILGGIVVALLQVAPAQAQATRTWVSGVGDDANPCSRTAPCKTFAGAISKTAAKGEINCLDPGGFGGVTITKSMTIRCDHVEAGVLVSGTNGIVIAAAATDRVVLEGLDIEGLGTGLNGVSVTGAIKEVYIIRCQIRDFTQNGVNMVSTTSGAHVFIRDSIILFNTTGVNVAGTANVGTIINTEIDGNTSIGLLIGNGAVVAVANSVINGSPNSVSTVGTGQSISFGPSNVVGAGTGFGPPVPFK